MVSARTALAALLLLASRGAAQTGGAAFAQGALPLWPGGAPGALGDSAADRPTITPVLAPGGNGAAVLVFPGGGYARLSMDREGFQVARWLNTLGVSAFVVQYRLGPRYHHPAMLHDAARAVRTVRARAAEWKVDPARVGVIGFSAGGHLASTVGTHFDAGASSSADPVERASSRPDFLMLLYPVITLDTARTHRGSRTNVLGPDPAPGLERQLSTETRVTRETPPTFIVHTTDDPGVPVENALAFYQAARNARVPVELHVFETGPHGIALGGDDPVLSSWPRMAELWMRKRGLLGAGKVTK